MVQTLTYCKKDGRLTWEKGRKRFVGELSDFREENLERLPREIDLTVKASGNTKRFYGHRKVVHGRGEDAEVGVWIWRSTDGFELHILND